MNINIIFEEDKALIIMNMGEGIRAHDDKQKPGGIQRSMRNFNLRSSNSTLSNDDQKQFSPTPWQVENEI